MTRESAMSAFDATIDALLPEWPALPPETSAAVSADCARFVRRQIALAPAHIRAGIHLVLVLFYVFAFFYLGMRPLGAVPRERRALALRAFAREQVPPFIALERVLRSMTLLAFLEQADVVAAIGAAAALTGGAAGAAAL
jgi:hypothetical protein